MPPVDTPSPAAGAHARRYLSGEELSKLHSVAAGRVVRAVFETTLPRGFHVNSNAPSDEFLKPTKLLLDTPAGVKIGRIDYPEPRPFKAEFSKEPLAVYEEHFVIAADLEIDQDLAPGDYP